jgi:hypothetical protein
MQLPCRNPAATPPRSCHSPKAGRSPTCRLRTADANSHIPHRSHAALCRGLETSLSERHIRGMAGERHRNGMACVNQTLPHCVNQMGKTQSKALAQRHGRGTAGEQHGNGRGTAWERQGNGMGTAWERHGMCESAFIYPDRPCV